MNSRKTFRSSCVWLSVLLMAFPFRVSAADSDGTAHSSQEELSQMLAPIALYPDSLLAQVMMASCFPLQVVVADRWVKTNSHLKGDDLNAALDKMDWDPSVKALVPFPQVLS